MSMRKIAIEWKAISILRDMYEYIYIYQRVETQNRNTEGGGLVSYLGRRMALDAEIERGSRN